jgi:photosystem II stability/assembly factor-like uncharacterized protein
MFSFKLLAYASGLALLTLAGSLSAAPDRWSVIGPGGGGAQYLPTISPHNPGVVLVACDMTGSYLTGDAGASWRMFNLRGRTSLFVFDPVRAGTIYAYGIGLYRSVDAGKRWSLVYPDPRNVRRLVSVGDHAEESIETVSGHEDRIAALAVDPADSKTLYAAFAAGKQTTFEVSTDWGKTWTAAGALQDGARAIYVDPRSPRNQRTIYVAGDSKVVIREAGAWRDGATAPGGPILSVSGGFPGQGSKLTVYAATRGGLALSTDGGASWAALPLTGLRIRAVAASANHPQFAYVSYGGLKRDGQSFFGVATTGDSGKSWSYPWQESSRAASNVDQGGWINPLLGPGWGENPLEIGVSPTRPEICYATDMGRTLKTEDGGKTWKAVYTRQSSAAAYTTTGLNVTTAYGVHFDPFDARRMFISYTDIGLFRSDDGGLGWRSAATHGVPKAWWNTTYWVEFDPEVKGRMWAVMSGTHDLPRPKMWRRSAPERFRGGVCRSDDGGETWTPQTNGIPQTAATHILLDRRSPKDARVLYVAGFGRGVYKSSDGGATWAVKNNGLPAHEPFAWRLAQSGDGTLYLVVARRSDDGSIGSDQTGNDQDGALYRSRDGAESWEKVPLPEGVNGPNGLQVDPGDSKRLYLAAWGRKHEGGDGNGGIFLSTDAGASWKQVLDRDNHIYDVTIDPKNPAHLYACGFESSVWRSTDRGVTWARVRGYNFKWGHRVILDPVHPGSIFVTTFGGSVWHGPAAGDPASSEDIETLVDSYGGAKR